MNKQIRIVVFAGAVIAAVFSVACTKEKSSKPATPEVVSDVAIVRTAFEKIPDSLAALGTVRASETSQLAAQTMGTVFAVNVREGDEVKKGQTLAVIDAAQAQAALERAEAALSAARHELTAAQTQRALAESTAKRYATLFERKSVSPQEFDEVKARSDAAAARAEAAMASESQAKAAVQEARTAFGYTKIRAPYDGVVTERKVDPGAMASPGLPLLSVEAFGKYRVEASVDEASLRFVNMGATVPVELDAYPDQKIIGRVTQIVPSADPTTRTFLVKIELPRSQLLRSGLSARAIFARGEREVVLLPQSAVVSRGSLKAVYVIGGDKLAELRYVTTGTAIDDRVEVLSGLGGNESVVQAPASMELGGKRVEVRR